MATRANRPKRVEADDPHSRRKAGVAAADSARIIAELRRELAERTAELARRDSELRDSNDRQTLVIRAVAEGIYDWDIAHNALWVSARLIEIFGWQGAGLGEGTRPSQDWNERVHPDDFAAYRAALRATLKGETAQLDCEYRIRLASGEYRWVEDRAVAQRDERGWAVRLVGAVSDVTERKETDRALREALDQQTATAEVLGVINSSPGELAPVWDAMLDKAMQLCGTAYGFLGIWQDDESLTLAALRGASRASPALAEYYATNPLWLGPRSGFSRVAQGPGHVQFDDISASKFYQTGDSYSRALVDLGGARSTLCVPLAKDGKALGLLGFFRQEVIPFSEGEIALVKSFAAQAVIAMENARLLTETREALDQQKASSDILRVISTSVADAQPVFEKILDSCKHLFGGDELDVLLVDDEGLLQVAAYLGKARDAVLATFPAPVDITPAGRAIRERRVAHYADVLNNPETPRVLRRMGEIIGYHSIAFAPMIWNDRGIGAIGVARSRGPFTDREMEILQGFADQAVIAINNARLFEAVQAKTRDLEESLEYQTATSDVLKVISRSTFDLQPVLDTLVETAARLCNAGWAHLALPHGDAFRSAATFSLSGEIEAAVRGITYARDRRTIVGRTAIARHVVHVEDIHADPEHRIATLPPAAQAIRTMLGVPLLREGEPIGVIAMMRTRVEPFTERQIELVRTFADQAVIAIENTRLITETQEALDQQTATAEVLQVINASPGNLIPVFEAMLEKAHRLCGIAHGSLYLYDGENFTAVATHGHLGPVAERLRQGFRGLESPGTRPLIEGARFSQVPDLAQIDNPVARAASEIGGLRTWLGVPLRKDGTLLGMISASRQEVRPYSEKEIALLENFAAQAVIAMENARLLGEIRAARDAAEAALAELRATQQQLVVQQKMAALGQLTAGIAHEIKNPLNFVNNFAGLSVELLDELKEAAAPGFAGLDAEIRGEIDDTIDLLTGNLDKIAEHGKRADNIVKSMLAHSRGTSGERQSVNLNDLIDEALNLGYHGARAQDQGFNITMERDFAAGMAPIELVPQDITRVFLNLFGNGFYAAKKRAQEAGDGFRPVLTVTTQDLGEAVEVRVRDNGTGIPPEHRERLFQPFFTTKPTGEGTGLGLSICYDIVTQQHGGAMTVDSEPGQFTEFTIRLPRQPQQATA